MPRLICFLVILLALSLSACKSNHAGQAQDDSHKLPLPVKPENCKSGWFPGQVKLLPGYEAETCQGMEYPYGRISKHSGMTISFYLQGGLYTDSAELWKEDQVMDGQHVLCSYRADQTAKVHFRGVQFDAKIQNQQELAEMLLMVLTYKPFEAPIKPSPFTNTLQ